MTHPTILFHVSDVHFGVQDHAAHDWFADAVRSERPDAVICTGDVTQRAKKSEFAAAQDWFRAMNVPIVLEPGNHDMPYYNPLERFSDPFRRFNRLASAVAGKPEFPNAALISLRTTVKAQARFPWSDGVVRTEALDQAVDQLGSLADDPRLKIVTCHHPLMAGPLGSENPTIHGDDAVLALARAGADVILSGHVHDPFDIVHEIMGRSVRMIGSGTLSTRVRNTLPGYNVLRVTKDGLQLERRELG